LETALVSFGGILLLLSLGSGALTRLKAFQVDQHVPAADRVAAGVIGLALIAIAIVLRIEAPEVSLLSTFGVLIFLTLLYCVFLAVTRPR
jgi:hypothetical protein